MLQIAILRAGKSNLEHEDFDVFDADRSATLLSAVDAPRLRGSCRQSVRVDVNQVSESPPVRPPRHPRHQPFFFSSTTKQHGTTGGGSIGTASGKTLLGRGPRGWHDSAEEGEIRPGDILGVSATDICFSFLVPGQASNKQYTGSVVPCLTAG